MRSLPFLPLSLLAVCLSGCPQSESQGATSTSTSTGTTGTSSGTTGSSAGTTGSVSCAGSAAAPALHCTSPAEGTEVLAGQTVEIACTLQATKPSWGVSVDASGAAVQDRLGELGRLYVTFTGATRPASFADTAVTVTVSGADCDTQSQAAQQSLHFTVVGNVLVTNTYNGTVDAYASDGTAAGTFLGPGQVSKPRLLNQLSDGTVLVGGESTGALPPLLQLDAKGGKLRTWDAVDHANKPLFSDQLLPWAAAEDGQGKVWVTAYTDAFHDGAIYRFDLQGHYLDSVPPPSDLATHQARYAPRGLARMADGAMVVALGSLDEGYVLRFDASGSSQTLRLPWEVCRDLGTSLSCAGNSSYTYGATAGLLLTDEGLLVLSDASSEAMVGLFNDQLGFVRSIATTDPGTTDRGLYNLRLAAAARVGSQYVVSQYYSGCLHALDPRTLASASASTVHPCWNLDNSSDPAFGLIRLGR
jgi:hypothetical protein